MGYVTSKSDFGAEMRKYKDTPGPNNNGSLGDGSELQRGKGTYVENRRKYTEDLAKKGDVAGLLEAAKLHLDYAEGTKDRGSGYASDNAHDDGKAAKDKAFEVGLKQGPRGFDNKYGPKTKDSFIDRGIDAAAKAMKNK